ncbi:MAG: hypothetical protein NT040_00305 [Bacteroidetes bacterium]|nr:hypothetical protein [Bacteroidota bacterium]
MTYQGLAQNGPTNTTRTNSQVTQTSTNAAPGNFVDNNKDGVCDNYQSRIKNGHGANSVDKTGMAFVITVRMQAREEAIPMDAGWPISIKKQFYIS